MKTNYLFAILIACLFTSFNSYTQTFTGSSGAIPDANCDVTNEFPVIVSGVGTFGFPNISIFNEVVINITHPFVADLDITLVAPDGTTTVELSTDNGGSGDNYTDTHFKNDALTTTNITDGTPPFTGDFLPEGDLSTLNGINADGTWLLRVCDDAGSDIGTLDSWSISFKPFGDNPFTGNSWAVPIGPDVDSNPIISTNAGATNTTQLPNPTTCGLNSIADIADGDVWFVVTIPNSGNVTVETSANTGSPITDMVMAVYEFPVIPATPIDCDDEGGTGNFSKIQLTGRTPGEQIAIRVWEYGNNAFGTFKISAYKETYVPDDNFENYLETHNSLNAVVPLGDPTSMGNGIANDDFVLTSRINTVLTLGVNNQSIADLTGIEAFVALTELNCNNNTLTSLNTSANTVLDILFCNQNNLTSLNLSQNTQLTILSCLNNNLASLDVSNNTLLDTLYSGFNPIGTLDVSNNINLTDLSCPDNQLTTLDLSNNINLVDIACYTNQLTSLDVSASVNLIELSCTNNQLIYLNMANGNNANFTILQSSINPNLTCVTVDNQALADDWNNNINVPTTFFTIDPNTVFNGPGICAPLNDLPTGAATLSVGGNFDEFDITDSNANTTASELTDASIPVPTGCGPFDSANYSGDDLWYTVSIPDDGSLIIETEIDDGSIIDTGLAVYSGTPGSLVQIACNDDIGGSDLFSQIILSGQTPSDVIYVRAWSWGNNETGTFKISAYRNPAITTYVPDDNFETYLETHDASDVIVPLGDPTSMGNGVIDDFVPTANINTVTSLDVNALSIADLTGIEGFTALSFLFAGNNTLTSIDVSQNTALIELVVYNNQLTSLDVGSNTLLTKLDFGLNPIDTINLSANSGLTELRCTYTLFTSLDISSLPNLVVLWAQGIPTLTSLNIANGNNINFTWLSISVNDNLTCVTVDNQTIADDWNNGVNVPPTGFLVNSFSAFSTDCSVTTVEPVVYLQGAYIGGTRGAPLMRDDLRTSSYLPTTINNPNNESDTVDPTVFNDGGTSGTGGDNDNIVDWVWVELRDDVDNTNVIEGQSGLLQRDGNIVGLDGINPLEFDQAAKHYNVVIKHRNHLGIITELKQAFPKNQYLDFVFGGTNTLGVNSQALLDGFYNGLWAGDTNGSGQVKFVGGSNDTDVIKDHILADPGNILNFLTYASTGYLDVDVDMNGVSKFIGAGDDSSIIKDNVLAHPGNILNFITFSFSTAVPPEN